MESRLKNRFWLIGIIIYITCYYAWLAFIPADSALLYLGGSFFSFVGTVVAGIWLLQASTRSKQSDKTYWRLLAFAAFSYSIAEIVWFVFESPLGLNALYAGYSDPFYILNKVFYFLAFGYILFINKRKLILVRFFFDVLIVMTVFTTFIGYYIISPIILTTMGTSWEVFLATLSPLMDLALLLCVVTLSFAGQRLFSPKMLAFIFMGLITQIAADTFYAFQVTNSTYQSGSWIDPLFILAVLLLGYTGLLQKEETETNTRTSRAEKPLLFFQFLFPYIAVTALILLNLFSLPELNIILLGIGATIFLIMIRQSITMYDNHRLIEQFYSNANQLNLSEQRYRSLFENHPEPTLSMDMEGNVKGMNLSAEHILGLKAEQVIENPLLEFIQLEFLEAAEAIYSSVTAGNYHDHDFPFYNHKGQFYHMSVTPIPIIVNNDLTGMYIIGRDMTELKKQQDKISYLAYHDSMTDLSNRIYFEGLLNKQIAQAKEDNSIFAILFMDLNNFKYINDTYGHAFGDDLLAAIAKRLKRFVSQSDYVARLGGDEFTLLIDSVSSYEDAVKQVNQLRAKLSAPYVIQQEEVNCWPSLGIACFPEDGTTSQELLNKADREMYANKRLIKELS
ncbi:diguanylate cyclase domain-containing protein [Alkalibacterium sp. MB6]|uniref:diguanylate cyclase domain-containing protein n=1 Tax=Alkalibacterium sp. MB6 TaxID=2081965 RepID=UPI00137A132B|nr:diguanylate cyclase [Alkalibacterium sp. MB6]